MTLEYPPSAKVKADPADPACSPLRPEFNTFMTVSECGSFSAAGRALDIRQSTVSRQISALEDRIGVSLFERSGAGVRLTDAGHQLLTRMFQIRSLVRIAIDEARDAGAARTGRLRLGFVGSFATSPAKDILGRLREMHPGLKVQLAELGVTDLIHRVLSHDLDCAWVASWRASDPALVLEPLWSEPLYLASPSRAWRIGAS